MREFMDGAEAIARGALYAGCTFFAGYPITPATPILLNMLRELPKVGGTAIQAEDEIASISMAIGAAAAGAKAMTATSGPGISLFSENIGLAVMDELPLVIVDVMRLGPATGGATTAAQGDVEFLRWGTLGGYPAIVLCPGNLTECYDLTVLCFNLAERLRTPVFLATDKETVATQATVDANRFGTPSIEARPYALETEDYIPYRIANLEDIPRFAPLGSKDHLARFTGSTHDERGILTKHPEKVRRLNDHLFYKIESRRAELEVATYDPQAGAETLIVSFGITTRSALEAITCARAGDKKVSYLALQSLFPVPEGVLKRALSNHRHVIVPELNHGQYRREVERLAWSIDPRPQVTGINRVDGELITPAQILAAI